MATLYINPSDSRCGACNRPADPHEPAHLRRLGYDPGEGCGEPFTGVASDYFGIEQSVRALRPDLPWVGLSP